MANDFVDDSPAPSRFKKFIWLRKGVLTSRSEILLSAKPPFAWSNFWTSTHREVQMCFCDFSDGLKHHTNKKRAMAAWQEEGERQFDRASE